MCQTKGSANVNWLSIWGILIGQGLAIVDSLGGTAMEALGDRNLPLTQAAMNYALLFVVNGLVMAYFGWSLHAKWYTYMGIAVVDSLGAYCLIKALKYTVVTSIGVLSCSGLILSIPLSHIFLKARFRFAHYAGAILFMAGILFLLLSSKAANSRGPHAIWGDLLLVCSSCLYTIVFIVMEKNLKGSVPTYEFLLMLSSFGFLFAFTAAGVSGELEHFLMPVNKTGLLRWGAFLSLWFVYSFMPYVLSWSGSTVGQLSLLSGSIWSVPIRLLLLGGLGSAWWILLVSVLLAIGGLISYASGGDVYLAHGDYCKMTPMKIQNHKVIEHELCVQSSIQSGKG